MIEAVKEVAQSSDMSYGSRRMKHALNALGYPVGRRKARSLMREAGVKARYRRKFKVTTNSDHKQPVFDNVLARDFSAAEPDQVYVGDITYIWTREGWLEKHALNKIYTEPDFLTIHPPLKVGGWGITVSQRTTLAA